MRTLLVPKLALAALAMSAALGAPAPGVSAQNVKENFHRLRHQHEQRSENGHCRHHHRSVVDRCRARRAPGDPRGRKGQVQGEPGAAQGAPEDAEGRLHSHAADAGVGSPLRASESHGGRRPPDRRRHRSPGRLLGGAEPAAEHGLPVHDPRAAPEQGRQGRGQDARGHARSTSTRRRRTSCSRTTGSSPCVSTRSTSSSSARRFGDEPGPGTRPIRGSARFGRQGLASPPLPL